LLTGLLQKDADMRLGWNEFFAHRCLQPITPRAATPKSSASSSAAKQIAQLEAELQEKEHEIEKLNETIAKWDEEKANQFNKIKELFERENNELRAALETQKKEGKEREELLVTQMNEMKKQHMAEMAAYKDMLSSKVPPMRSCACMNSSHGVDPNMLCRSKRMWSWRSKTTRSRARSSSTCR
jgi:septal ring factor EnvC (AmiA/AmiB activator)